jgi:DNA-binding response OmpR family regulator
MSEPAVESTVLLVEDDDLVLRLLIAVLRRGGFRVVSATDIATALLVASRERPDLCIIDVHLGRQSGLDLLERIRLTPELENTSAIVMSGGDPEQYEHAASALRASFVAKPVSPSDLLVAVRDALPADAGRRALEA